jgi:hypothetical protein
MSLPRPAARSQPSSTRSTSWGDTQHGKMISLAKIAIGAVTGKPMDGGVKGSLKV